jgi:hypothetical protein
LKCFPFAFLKQQNPDDASILDKLSSQNRAIRIMGQNQRTAFKQRAMERQVMQATNQPIQPSMLHHKFLVGMNRNGDWVFASFGSFNFTKNASESAEDLTVTTDGNLIRAFFQEWYSLVKFSY